MEKYPRYTAYKSCDQKWIGSIPEHWNIKRVKYIFKEINQRVHGGSEEELLSVSQYTGVTKKSDSREEDEFLTNASSLDGYKKVAVGDLVINIMLAWNGSLGVSGVNGITSPAYGVYRIRKDLNSRYFHYLFKTRLYLNEFRSKSTGVIESRLRLYTDSFNKVFAIFPPHEEQNLIVAFLDRKIEEINKFISLKQRAIELLKERKTVIVNQAVTKGLNPNAEMKETQIGWLGRTPKHWEIKRLKYLFRIKKVIANRLGYNVLSITQKGIKIKDIESNEGQLSMDYSKYQLVDIGDFAMNHMDLLTGYVDISKYHGVISPDYRVFVLTAKNCLATYFLYLLQLCYKNKVFYGLGQGSSQLGRWRFAAEEFRIFEFPKPPADEQQRIVEFLDRKLSEIDSTILAIESEIKKAEEYQEILINEVATGKIDVRH